MGNFLIFAGGMLAGAALGVVAMCCFITSGRESRTEEKYLNGKQD